MINYRFIPRPGFEPRYSAPKADVLPLDDHGSNNLTSFGEAAYIGINLTCQRLFKKSKLFYLDTIFDRCVLVLLNARNADLLWSLGQRLNNKI